MSKNVEIKAKARNFFHQKQLAEQLADEGPDLLQQRDVFFHVPHGRLKLRYLAPDCGNLITYERPDNKGPKTSQYEIYGTSDPARLEQVLSGSLDIRGVVEKKRTLYLVGQTRIHMDEVAGLGHYLELEVVLTPDQSAEQGQAIARDLMTCLEVEEADLIDAAYIDLLDEVVSPCGV